VTTPSDPRQSGAAEDHVRSGHSAHGENGHGAVTDQALGNYGSQSAPRSTTAGPRVRRPPEAWAGAVFLTLAALPAAVFGLLLAVQPGNIGVNLRARIDAANSTVSTDILLTVFRLAGAMIVVLAFLFLLFAWLAVRPRRGARPIATALAVLEVVLLAGAMVVAGVDAVSLGIVLLAVAGTVLLYLPRSQEFITARA